MGVAGLGVAVSYKRTAQPYMSSGDLVRLFDGWNGGSATVRIACAANRHQPGVYFHRLREIAVTRPLCVVSREDGASPVLRDAWNRAR